MYKNIRREGTYPIDMWRDLHRQLWELAEIWHSMVGGAHDRTQASVAAKRQTVSVTGRFPFFSSFLSFSTDANLIRGIYYEAHSCGSYSEVSSLKVRVCRPPSNVNGSCVNQILAVPLHYIEAHAWSTSSFSIQGIERVNRLVRGENYVKKLCSREHIGCSYCKLIDRLVCSEDRISIYITSESHLWFVIGCYLNCHFWIVIRCFKLM